MSARSTATAVEEEGNQGGNGSATMEPPTVSNGFSTDHLEAIMTLAHAELLAAARIRSNMTGHLNKAMEAKLNESVATAAARYADALGTYEAASP